MTQKIIPIEAHIHLIKDILNASNTTYNMIRDECDGNAKTTVEIHCNTLSLLQDASKATRALFSYLNKEYDSVVHMIENKKP